MKNQTTEELAKTYYQAMMEASEAGNHKEFVSLFFELGKASTEALLAAYNTQDENGERALAQASRAAVDSGAPLELIKMQTLEAKRKLQSLGYNEVFDERLGFTRWEHTRTGHRPMLRDPREVLESLKEEN